MKIAKPILLKYVDLKTATKIVQKTVSYGITTQVSGKDINGNYHVVAKFSISELIENIEAHTEKMREHHKKSGLNMIETLGGGVSSKMNNQQDIISTKLASRILQLNIKEVQRDPMDENMVRYKYSDNDKIDGGILILGHLHIERFIKYCKEWLWGLNEDFSISYNTIGRGRKEVVFSFYGKYGTAYNSYKRITNGNKTIITEEEAVIKACEWVLENE